jgi:hypothetical protein
MYGRDWKTPKKMGSYEKDVLDQIPRNSLPGHAGKLKQFTIDHLLPGLATRIKVLDSAGKPVKGAEVVAAGLDHSVTDRQGYAKLYIPYDYVYSLIIRYDAHEEVLYEENICPRKTYVYRTDAQTSSGRNFILTLED